ncbi:hypothetical protein KIMH_11740 [Bombiscardovia apis]|uniref:ABC transporter domain-containing protein n=1 Tax=Bombiscardovia apis TaxID=2932182 RepID=A0ABM8BE59_9BIFI|nr:ATP-binding cassette domain-containing protein [Bombiscardovia apis]BDR55063.1 hypothetical protein KIMH_11740 [Bombiscardovia apis]
MTLLEARGIAQTFAGGTVLEDANLDLRSGEVVGLLGTNGAGKSTLFKILSGLQTPVSGEVSINAQPMSATYPASLREMGVSIDQPVFYEELSGLANLEIHCAYMRLELSGDAISKTLGLLGLKANNPTAVKRYSMGMRQRLALARCIIHQPRILLLDEPLNGLDPKGIIELRSIIRDQAAAGKAVLFSSHILSEVLRVADRVLVLNSGRICLNRSVSQLKQDGDQAAEAALIQAMEA